MADIADAIRSEAAASSRPGQYERLMSLAKFVDKMESASDELEQLRRWKVEALEVLDQWYQVADVVERVSPCPLGHSRVNHVRQFVTAAARRHA